MGLRDCLTEGYRSVHCRIDKGIARRQWDGVDQIRERRRQLATFGDVSRLRLCQGGRVNGERIASSKLPDRAQHLQPVGRRDAEVFEAMICQLQQVARLNLALAKCDFV
jgi:hypothetical protein